MRADIEGADRPRRYQVLLGWPATSDLNTYVNNNLLLEFSITVYDINISNNIYGEATPILQGKIRSRKPTVHLKIETFLHIFQYQRDTKTYIYIWKHFT